MSDLSDRPIECQEFEEDLLRGGAELDLERWEGLTGTEIEEREPPVHVTARNLHHEAQIALDHALTRFLVALLG